MRKNARLPKVLSNKIRKIRNNKGMTQEELAHKVGISRVYMGYIEQGRYVPSLAILDKIARALKTQPSELLVK